MAPPPTTPLQGAKEAQEWSICARLVAKRIFFKKKDDPSAAATIGLILVFIDQNGHQFELQTWSTRMVDRRKKVFTVYRKVHNDDCYQLISTNSRPGLYFRAPKAEFSTSELEYARGWWAHPIDDFKLNRYLDCSTNFQSSIGIMAQGKPVNLMASFLGLTEGPSARYVHGRPTVRGYFVKLADEAGCVFLGLVWHTVRIDRAKFSLFHVEKGDAVLLIAARLSRPPKAETSKALLTVTTNYAPVVNSKCVSPKRITALREKYRTTREFVPATRDSGIQIFC